MLRELRLEHIGPAPEFEVEFGKRLNLFTGDNGLGKSFMLDIAWWVLTSTWAGGPARPRRARNIEPFIRYGLSGSKELRKSKFDFAKQFWPRDLTDLPQSGLVIYARVDDSFSVRDPARVSTLRQGDLSFILDQAFHFSPDTLWNGLKIEERLICNGLIADWVRWQYQSDQDETSPFRLLTQVIEQLSPHPGEWMRPGKPTRVSVEDVRDFPTIDLPYGNIPVTEASAGMKRILSLAYLLVWTWYEHTRASELLNQEPTDRLVFLIDEVESHLHPQWQRMLLPTILELGQNLQPEIKTQVIATTHSPLVLASVEPNFDKAQDRLFLFDLQNGNVTLDYVPWAKQGDVIGWLTSDIFGLKQARSREAEAAIEAAEALMRDENMADYPPHLRTRKQIDKALRDLLPGHDPFWPRWIVETNFLSERGFVKGRLGGQADDEDKS
jgi:hypothetical protein